MLFRTVTGELVEINKYNYQNDSLYYKKIVDLKTSFTKNRFTKLELLDKTFNNKNGKKT